MADGDSISDAAGEPAVFRAKEYSVIHTPVAITLLFGSIHFTFFLILLALFFFLRVSLAAAALVCGVILFFMLSPIDEESKLGRKISRYICKYAPGYFPITLYVEDVKVFDPNQAYVFACEPHSVLPVGILVLSRDMGFMPLPKIKSLASSLVFYVPFLRQIWTWMGLIPVSRKYFCRYLEAGYSCVLVPGGFQEMLHMDHNPETEVAFVESRKGFVRIAIEIGRPIVPVVCFGQNVFNWWRPESRLIFRICRALKLIPMIYWGRFGSFVPLRSPIHIVVGRPMDLTKSATPSAEEVDKIHAKFVESLKELFDKYKERVGYPHLHLRIV